MGFGAGSAIGVPQLQRGNSLATRGSAWSWRRALRGCANTAACALWLLLGRARLAGAEPVARFADLPTAPSAAASAPPPAVASPAPSDPAPSASLAAASAATPPAAAAAASSGWSRNLALTHLERALRLEQRGDLAQALSEYTVSLSIDSTLGEAYLRLGALRERMGDPREAALVYSEALHLGDTRARALLQRSHLFRTAGQPEQALRDLEAAVALDANSDALRELAGQYVEGHAFSAALFTFRRIVASAQQSGDSAGLEAAKLEVRALRVLAAEADPTSEQAPKHDWVGRSLVSIARR